MRCKNCGVENTDETKYCRNCGYELNESTTTELTSENVQKYFKKIYYTFLTAITFLIVSYFIPILYTYFYHTPLNPSLELLNVILIILGSLFTIYFYIQFYKMKDESMLQNNEPYYSQIKKLAYLLLLMLISMLLNYVAGY